MARVLKLLRAFPFRFFNGDMSNINKVEEVDPVFAAINLVMQRQASQQGWRFGRNRYFFNDKI